MEELIFCFIYISLAIIIAFLYTEIIINQKPERLNVSWFVDWFRMMFVGFGSILFVVTILLRNYYGTIGLENKKEFLAENTQFQQKSIELLSSLKKESFWVEEASIVYVRSEDNYVHIYFKEEELLREKMIRNTLTNIGKQLPQLIKTHRSYLINPKYVISLKGNAQNAKLQLKTVENSIPVSKTYFDVLKTFLNSPQSK